MPKAVSPTQLFLSLKSCIYVIKYLSVIPYSIKCCKIVLHFCTFHHSYTDSKYHVIGSIQKVCLKSKKEFFLKNLFFLSIYTLLSPAVPKYFHIPGKMGKMK